MNIKAEQKDVYAKSRILYWFEAAFEYCIGILAGGAFLAKLTSEIGISDSMTAILTSITAFAGASQIVSIYISHKGPVKKWVLSLKLLSNVLLCFLYLIPFMPIGKLGMSALFFALILVSKFSSTITSPLRSAWFMNLVPMKNRGNYTALLQIVSLIFGATLSFAAGTLIDKFDSEGNVKGAFLILTVTICVFAVIDLLSLVLSREKPIEQKTNVSIAASIKELSNDKRYKKIFWVFVLEAVANSAITPFLGTYQVNELEFSMAFISELSIIVSLVQMVSVFLAGKLSMHLEHKTLLRIGFPIVAVSYLINIFTVPANGTYMYIIYSVVHTLGVAALSVSRTNILLEMIPRQNHVAAISLNAIATGILSFLTTLALSPVVSLVQKSGNTVFGISVYAQQLLSALAVLLYLILIVYYNLALIPEIDNKQNRVYPREE